jgi:hypothetical protein
MPLQSHQIQILLRDIEAGPWPRRAADERVAKFKSRARARHESFNGRLKFFDILQNTFRHGEARHKIAFEAVCVIVQYQMDNGSPLFDTW